MLNTTEKSRMSLIPMLFSNWWEDLERPHRLLDQNFGMGLRHEQIPALEHYWPASRHGENIYCRPWRTFLQNADGGSSVIKADKDQFQVVLDVQQFKPEEINVKLVDNCVVVEGKHEEKRDEHGWISRQFERRYMIPDQCNIDEVSSSLSSDGVLIITAPRKEQPKMEDERQIKIEHTGKPAVKDAPASEQQDPAKK